ISVTNGEKAQITTAKMPPPRPLEFHALKWGSDSAMPQQLAPLQLQLVECFRGAKGLDVHQPSGLASSSLRLSHGWCCFMR
ncbi:MAG TPA: hypothetical protein QGI30_06990, partial [Anaerolineales bacterium]|nr:hypothetical protein [Anaerolineales bacterium]